MNDTAAPDELESLLAAATVTGRDDRLAHPRPQRTRIAAHASHTVEACLRRASAATAREDRLVALSQALALDPHHEAARRAMHEALERHLTDDAFLTYVGETDATYRVETPDGLRIVVPKRRAVPRPYPPTEPGPLRPASRWLLLALLGLLPSGLGTLLFAPIALFSALRLRPSTLRPKDQRRRRVFIAAALLLWILGLSLGLLVLIHL